MQLYEDIRVETPKNEGLKDIRRWFRSDLGQNLLASEKAVVDELLPGLFGYHLVQMGVFGEPMAGASQINHRIQLGLEATDECSLQASVMDLPFLDDSIDLVFLHHLLEFVESPKRLLKEAARVTMPSGHLVVVGFNPMSLWGIWKSLARWSGNPPWNGYFIAPGRLMDWLNLLDFRIDRIHFAVNGLPLWLQKPRNKPDYSGGLKTNWPFGAVYVIVARKEVAGVTPLKQGWLRREATPHLNVVRSSGRSSATH